MDGLLGVAGMIIDSDDPWILPENSYCVKRTSKCLVIGMEASKHHQGEIHSGDIPDADELVGVSSVAGRVIPHKWRFSSLGRSTVNGGIFKQTTFDILWLPEGKSWFGQSMSWLSRHGFMNIWYPAFWPISNWPLLAVQRQWMHCFSPWTNSLGAVSVISGDIFY